MDSQLSVASGVTVADGVTWYPGHTAQPGDVVVAMVVSGLHGYTWVGQVFRPSPSAQLLRCTAIGPDGELDWGWCQWWRWPTEEELAAWVLTGPTYPTMYTGALPR